ncbi:MAG: hypothetical protein K2X03_24195 [Bryobacteraceae bacterium]|nr:hypothetical protein [Bryobacteraceae bacterium]
MSKSILFSLGYLLGAVSLVAQLQTGSIQVDTTALNGNAGLAGVVEGFNPGRAEQVRVTAMRTNPATPLAMASIALAKDGSFSLTSLPAGTYQICLTSAEGDFVDPCVWGLAPPTAVVGVNQKLAAQRYSLVKGARLKVRLDDPNGFLQARTGDAAPPHVLIGVINSIGALLPLTPSQTSRTGIDYEMVVPIGSPLKYAVFSQTAAIQDDSRQAIPAAGLFRDLVVPAGPAAAPAIRLIVSGRK